jgi:hypothetical protein
VSVSIGSRHRLLTPNTLVVALVLVGVANLVVLLAQASAIVHNVYLDSDNASALVLPALASHMPAGSIVNLGNHPWYEPWWAMRATIGLPGHRELWEALPFLYGLAGAAAVAACAWWALGRVAALMTAVVLLAASEAQRQILYVPEAHVLVALHVAALCAGLMFAMRRAKAGSLLAPGTLLVAAALTLFTAAGLTDQLLLVSGLIPYVLAPVLCWWRERSPAWRDLALFALATALVALLGGHVITHVMKESGVTNAPFPVNFVGSEALFTSMQNLVVTIATLGGGSFFAQPASGENIYTFVAGILTLAGVVAVLRALLASARAARAALAQPPAARRAALETRELFVLFWGLVLLVVLLVFTLTSVSGNQSDGRYLIGAWIAAAALLGVLASSPVRTAVVMAGVLLFALLNFRSELARPVAPAGDAPNAQLAGQIEHFVLAHGASLGYGSYWDVAPITWETQLHVKVYPVVPCVSATGLCQFTNNEISSWYTPHAGTATFLLTDSRPGIPLQVSTVPPAFGQPVAAAHFAEGLTAYVFDHDIAAQLTP